MRSNFQTDISLQDDAILLRPLARGDWQAMFAAASDPLIWALHPAHDRWQESVFRGYFEEALAQGSALAVVDKASGAIIGSSRYGFDRSAPGEVEIGWTFLTRAYWGTEINRRMKRLMLAHALQHFDQAIFLVGEYNHRSRRAMEKIGGRLTDRFHTAEVAGARVRHVIYAIDRQNFAAGPLLERPA